VNRCRNFCLESSAVAAVSSAVLIVCLGCGGPQKPLAPVSGVIKLDGKPLAGGSVFFQPKAPPGSTVAGKGSSGQCDSTGRFQLITLDDKPGAVVAEHKVAVYGPRGKVNAASDSAPIGQEIVPRKYNIETELLFTVPQEGSDQANFDLTSK
jgi:hypothetical protein